MKFAIGVVTYNRKKSFERVLDGLRRQNTYPDEIQIVDDSDNDEVESLVDDVADGFRDEGVSFNYHRRHDASSMVTARNQIIDTTECDVLGFLDDDVLIPDSYVQSLIDAYERFPEATGIGGPALKATEDKEIIPTVKHSGDCLNFVNKYGGVTDHSHMWIPPEPVEVDVCRGANMSFRVDALRELNGFEPDYGGTAAFEEWDMMTRIRHNGGTLMYVPSLQIYHLESESGGSRDEQVSAQPQAYWFARNSILFRKNNFRSNYYRSLYHILCKGTNQFPPLWKRLGRTVSCSTTEIAWIKGYLHGMMD